jgi:hypothetical protein
MMFNYLPDRLGPEDWTQTPAGHGWIAVVLAVIFVLALVEAIRRRNTIAADRWQFGIYLMATAVMAAFSYAVLGCHVRDLSLIRYTLLTLYFPVGLLVLFISAKPPAWSRAVVLGLIAVWAAFSLLDNGRFLAAYLHRPPSSPARELVTFLEGQGVRYGRGTYWVAYQVDFLSRERVTIASLDKVRVQEYQKIADDHEAQTVYIRPNRGWPLRPCDVGVSYRLWCLEHLDRAKNAAP